MGEKVSETEYRRLNPDRVRTYDIRTDTFRDTVERDWEMLQAQITQRNSTYLIQGRTQADWNSALDEFLWLIKQAENT